MSILRLTQNEQKVLEDFKKHLARKFGPRLVLLKLFGSKARGDFHQESDLDVIIVLKDLKEQDNNWISALSWELSLKHNVFISEIIFSDSQWTMYQTKRFSLARNVKEEGIKL